MKYDVFISYRREGGYDTAKHLNDLLVRDGYKVSFDIDTLRSGDFDTQLLRRIDECEDFVLIVDKNAFDRTLDPNFNPKNDWLRCELSYALKKNKNIIPVFLSGVSGFPSGLPSDVVGVMKKNGPEYNRYYFNDFYKTLKSRFLHRKRKNFRLIILLVILVLVGIFTAKNYLRIDNNTKIEESKIATITEDKLDVHYIINLFIEQCKENGSNAYWNIFSTNELLAPKDLDVCTTEENSYYSEKLDYNAKLRFKGNALMKNDSGQDAICKLRLLGCHAGPMMLEIELLSGGDSTIVENANIIAQEAGFEYLNKKEGLSYESFLYKKDDFYFLICINSGSGGCFVTMYISNDKEAIDFYDYNGE